MTVTIALVSAAAVLYAQGVPASGPAPVTPSNQRPLATLVDVEIRPERLRVPINTALNVEFIVRNKTAELVELSVPVGELADKIPAGLPIYGMGLPLEHVFSGERFRGLTVAAEGDPYLGDRVVMTPSRTVPSIVLAPLAEVGLKFDVTRYYPVLRQPGRYELRWRPYGGKVESPPVTIEVRTVKQVVMETDAGRLTFRLLYDKAPATVENFIELVEQRFYDGLQFFLVNPALAIQGGCPRNDGTGRRTDGRLIPPEFNDTPFVVGTVGMSLTQLSSREVDPHSASCQFFICVARQPALDGRYTAFAQIEGPESMETLNRIATAPRTPKGRPLKPVAIRSATVLDAPTPP